MEPLTNKLACKICSAVASFCVEGDSVNTTNTDAEQISHYHRPYSENDEFECFLRRTYKPEVMRVEVDSSTVVWVESYVFPLLEDWSTRPGKFADQRLAEQAAIHLFADVLYCGDWRSGIWLAHVESTDTSFDGLNALCDMFIKQVRQKHFRFQQAGRLPHFDPAKNRKIPLHEKVCDLETWVKSFSLAMQDFLIDSPDDLHPTLEEAIKNFVRDLQFSRRSVEVRERRQRKLLPILRQFARCWDTFPVPLRYFTDLAAHQFCMRELGLSNKSLDDYRCIFRRGGSAKKGLGLSNLEPDPDSVIESWPDDDKDRNFVYLRKDAAKRHGLNPRQAAEEIEQRTGKLVTFS